MENSSDQENSENSTDFGNTISYDFGRSEEKASAETKDLEFDLKAVEQALISEENDDQKNYVKENDQPETASKEETSSEEEQEKELDSVAPVLSPPEVEDIDFESKLEESLREL